MASERTLQGALTFLGFIIGVVTVFYFAGLYVEPLSSWSKMAALGLGAIAFVYLGLYIQGTSIGAPFFDGARLRWLRPSVVLYLLAIIATIRADVVFIADVRDVPDLFKVLANLALAIALIVVAARTRKAKGPEGAPPAPGP